MNVSEVLRLPHEGGWYLIATRSSHRQLKHRIKSGRVTVPGKPSDDLAPGTLNSILKQSGLKKPGRFMCYAIVIETAGANFSACVPDLPGCVATGATLEATEQAIREAIEFHLDGLREDGTEYAEVAA